MKATICEFGEEAGVVIPKDMLEQLGWKIGDVLSSRTDGNVLELQLLRARTKKQQVTLIVSWNMHGK